MGVSIWGESFSSISTSGLFLSSGYKAPPFSLVKWMGCGSLFPMLFLVQVRNSKRDFAYKKRESFSFSFFLTEQVSSDPG